MVDSVMMMPRSSGSNIITTPPPCLAVVVGQGFERSRAAPSLRSIESQPSIQVFVVRPPGPPSIVDLCLTRGAKPVEGKKKKKKENFLRVLLCLVPDKEPEP
ncbi:hypothetical protein GOODEAATRI_034578 [Goodea atripinnis]|uniref:Uncharacterized protein n=1 Tax=Goodea atripinnis TaxID=208336 RepID=A0ABV0PTY8_9TELE